MTAAAISKAAEALARRAVYGREMHKQAQDEPAFRLPRAAQTALIGSLVGGAGTGLISALTGRDREQLLRDLLLGAAVGGVGGAAYPYAEETLRDLWAKVDPDLTPAEARAESARAGAEAAQTGAEWLSKGKAVVPYATGALGELFGTPGRVALGAGGLAGGTALQRIAREAATPLKGAPWKRWVRRGIPTGGGLAAALLLPLIYGYSR